MKNRVIMVPIATNFADHSGGVTEQMTNYYVERAKGGTGLIIVENANVDYPSGVNGAVQLRIDEDRFIPGLALLREALNDADPTCRVALQINHPGGATKSTRTNGMQVVGASNIPVKPQGETPRPLSAEEIEALAGKYALAAERAQKAGFDAVEIHGGFCYLIAQFLSPFCNRRTDDFGGSAENRIKFPVIIIQKIRRLLGNKFPILFRMNAAEFFEGGLTLADSKIYAKILADATVDMLHVTAGSGYSVDKHIEPMSYPQAWKAYLSAEIKKEVAIPVAVVGTIREPEVAEEIIAAGKTDFVALGRALIADPYWVSKSMRGQAVNRCISCNSCAGRRLAYDIPIRCSVNPTAGNEKSEKERKFQATAAKKVLVVGGGPAGMRAAIEANKDGHQVILLEKENNLGGRGLIAAVPPRKEKVKWLTDDLIRQVESADIDIRLGITADIAVINSFMPDIVILAIGSDTCPPSVWGNLATSSASVAEDILKKSYRPSALTIGIIGGGSVGCECAEYFSEANNIVYLYEMTEKIAADCDPISRNDILKNLTEKK